MCFVHLAIFPGLCGVASFFFTASYQLLPWKCFLLKPQRSQISCHSFSILSQMANPWLCWVSQKGSKCFSLHRPTGYCLNPPKKFKHQSTKRSSPGCAGYFNCPLVGNDVQGAAVLLHFNNQSTGDVHKNCLRRVNCQNRDECRFKRNVSRKNRGKNFSPSMHWGYSWGRSGNK